MREEIIGSARLILGDAREVIPTLDKVNLVVTDPPYRTISGGTNSALGFGWRTSVLAKNDGKIFDNNDISPVEIAELVSAAMDDNADCYVMTNNLNLLDFMNAMKACGMKFHNFLQWQKDTATANRWYMNETEHTLYYYKGSARPINDCASKQIFFAPNPRNKQHPTEKPVALMAHYIGNSTDVGQAVLDPFMGSGSAGVACANLGRPFIGVELDPMHFETACRRISEARRAPADMFAAAPKPETLDMFA